MASASTTSTAAARKPAKKKSSMEFFLRVADVTEHLPFRDGCSLLNVLGRHLA